VPLPGPPPEFIVIQVFVVVGVQLQVLAVVTVKLPPAPPAGSGWLAEDEGLYTQALTVPIWTQPLCCELLPPILVASALTKLFSGGIDSRLFIVNVV
jgi:hypothetical protein